MPLGTSENRGMRHWLPIVLLCVTLWQYPLGMPKTPGEQAVEERLELRVCERHGQRFLEAHLIRVFTAVPETPILERTELVLPWSEMPPVKPPAEAVNP